MLIRHFFPCKPIYFFSFIFGLLSSHVSALVLVDQFDDFSGNTPVVALPSQANGIQLASFFSLAQASDIGHIRWSGLLNSSQPEADFTVAIYHHQEGLPGDRLYQQAVSSTINPLSNHARAFNAYFNVEEISLQEGDYWLSIVGANTEADSFNWAVENGAHATPLGSGGAAYFSRQWISPTGGAPINARGFSVSIAKIPEPSVWLLFIGLSVITLRRL